MQKKKPTIILWVLSFLKCLVLATSYFPFYSIIATTVLNCRIRNENGCDHCVESPEPNIQFGKPKVLKLYFSEQVMLSNITYVMFRFPNRNRVISTPQLNVLLRLHLVPINVVISHGPQTIINLEVGFPLICFQRLSIPDIATRQCPW